MSLGKRLVRWFFGPPPMQLQEGSLRDLNRRLAQEQIQHDLDHSIGLLVKGPTEPQEARKFRHPWKS